MSKHTPGPWRWEFNAKHGNLHLVGGQLRYDLTIIDFERWGMNGATMRLRDTAHDGMNIMHRVHERPDWIAPEPGREHHKHWHQLLTHPDARLIEAAPDLLTALKDATDLLQVWIECCPPYDEALNDRNVLKKARSAIAKAEGSPA